MKKKGLLTFEYPKSLCTLQGEINVNPVSKVYLHKLQENIATDLFMTSTFWTIDYSKPV